MPPIGRPMPPFPPPQLLCFDRPCLTRMLPSQFSRSLLRGPYHFTNQVRLVHLKVARRDANSDGCDHPIVLIQHWCCHTIKFGYVLAARPEQDSAHLSQVRPAIAQQNATEASGKGAGDAERAASSASVRPDDRASLIISLPELSEQRPPNAALIGIDCPAPPTWPRDLGPSDSPDERVTRRYRLSNCENCA